MIKSVREVEQERLKDLAVAVRIAHHADRQAWDAYIQAKPLTGKPKIQPASRRRKVK